MGPFVAAADPLIGAICSKSKEQLEAVVNAAAARGKPVPVPADADHDALAAAVYASAKAEVDPAHATPWPGCDSVPSAQAKPTQTKPTQAKSSAKQEQWQQMAGMVMKKHDSNSDSQLTRDELKGLIESTNAAAKAQGKAAFEGDFFDSVDANKDGVANRAELESFFKAQMSGQKAQQPSEGAKGGGAPKTSSGGAKGGSPEDLMFRGLDKDGDGTLSLDEMATIIAKVNQQASNQAQGETGEDFFRTLDRDGSGGIDREEAAAFFAAASSMVGSSAGKDEV